METCFVFDFDLFSNPQKFFFLFCCYFFIDWNKKKGKEENYSPRVSAIESQRMPRYGEFCGFKKNRDQKPRIEVVLCWTRHKEIMKIDWCSRYQKWSFSSFPLKSTRKNITERRERERWDEWMGNEVENILFFDDAVYCYSLLLDGHKHKAKQEEESNLWK